VSRDTESQVTAARMRWRNRRTRSTVAGITPSRSQSRERTAVDAWVPTPTQPRHADPGSKCGLRMRRPPRRVRRDRNVSSPSGREVPARRVPRHRTCLGFHPLRRADTASCGAALSKWRVPTVERPNLADSHRAPTSLGMTAPRDAPTPRSTTGAPQRRLLSGNFYRPVRFLPAVERSVRQRRATPSGWQA
jgi:hypothetical protein